MSLTPNDAVTMTAALRRMQLIGPDERPAFSVLTGGISSLIVRAETRRGPLCVKQALPQLKVAATWLAPVERNGAEVAWMRVAAAAAPRSVPAVLGQDALTHSFAMEYLDPADYPVWKIQLRDGVAEPGTARAVAAVLAAVHNATAQQADIVHAFANDAAFYALRLEPYFAATARVHADCAPALERLIGVTASTRLALVHGDVSPKNILIGSAGPLLLDAECAWYGDPAFDLAFCLNHLLLKCLWRPQATAGFLACFDALAQTYLAAVRWEAAKTLEARTAALLPAMLLARIDGKSPIEYLTAEVDKQRVRSFAKPIVQLPLASLDEIRRRWARETGK